MRKMEIRTLYQDDEVTLQRIIIKIGTCKMHKFRQITNINGELDVRELKDIPAWYLRMKKLKQLGI
jgi:hypothetical protein